MVTLHWTNYLDFSKEVGFPSTWIGIRGMELFSTYEHKLSSAQLRSLLPGQILSDRDPHVLPEEERTTDEPSVGRLDSLFFL